MNTPKARSESWYSATALNDTVHPALEGELRVDVAIVGAGFTGVATALELARKGFSVALLEANRVGWGATGRNGGQITGSLSGDEAMLAQLKQTKKVDAEAFVRKMRWRGHEIIKTRVEEYSIDCDLEFGHLHAAYKPSHLVDLQNSYDEACKSGLESEVRLLSKEEVPNFVATDIYHGGLLNRKNMHVHSLNLCLGEAAVAVSLGVKIFENTEITEIQHGSPVKLVSRAGQVTADSVLIAGNAYHRLDRKRLSGLLFPAALANMTTACLEEGLVDSISPENLAVYDTRFVLDYYRMTSDGRLMFGGGANYSARDPVSIANMLTPAMIKTFPALEGVEIDYQWTGMAGITVNRIPQFGRLSENVFYAQGYSGHGIATSHIAGEVMADAIAGTMEDFDILSSLRQYRIPFGDLAGQSLLSLGMLYYQLRERFG